MGGLLKIIGFIFVVLVAVQLLTDRPKTEAEILKERKEAEDRCPDPEKCREANRKAYAETAAREAAEKKAASARYREQLFIVAAKKDIAAAMRDPDSVVFGDIFVSRKAGETICGTVNAKNGFGGYTGMKPFVVFMKDGRMALDDAAIWNRHCAGRRG